MDDLQKQIDQLKEDLLKLQNQRITQSMILPDVIKTRMMGEGNRYITAGLDANLPTGNSVTGSVVYYFATDTNKLYIWNGTAFKSTTLT